MNILSRLFSRIFCDIEVKGSRKHLNVFKTLYINFRCLPFQQAIKFPIFIYGPVSLTLLAGKIIIESSKVTRGMIKLGYRQGIFSQCKKGALIYIEPKASIVFTGSFMIDYDYVFRVTNSGVLKFGLNCGIGSNNRFYCDNAITIGDFCRMPFDSIVMDSNYHYSVNMSTEEVHRKSAPVVIGSHNWIGNNTYISKGTITPDWTIIAARSFLNKDYTKFDYNGSIMLAGAPAKKVGENFRRVYNLGVEAKLNCFFNTSVEKVYVFEQNDLDNAFVW